MSPPPPVTPPPGFAQGTVGRWLGRWAATVLTVANLVGVALYLWGASQAWAIPEERAAGITSVTGEPIIWGLFVLPVWAVFALVNSCWAIAALTRPPRRRDVRILIALAALWVVAVIVDFAHH